MWAPFIFNAPEHITFPESWSSFRLEIYSPVSRLPSWLPFPPLFFSPFSLANFLQRLSACLPGCLPACLPACPGEGLPLSSIGRAFDGGKRKKKERKSLSADQA
jgi:hypothetical protein